MTLVESTGQIFSSVRFDLLDHENNIIGEIHPRKDSPASITNDTTQTIKRTLDGLNFTATDEPDINTLTERIRPVWIDQDLAEYPLGIFLFADADRSRLSYGLELVPVVLKLRKT